MRKTIFSIGEFYHIYNRGVDKRDVFIDENDYLRFLVAVILANDEEDGWLVKFKALRVSQRLQSVQGLALASRLSLERFDFKQVFDFKENNLQKPLVKIVAFCFNPNHYHFILEQLEEKGIEKFMHRVGTAYTMYFNKKYKRSGSLFQGSFKSIHIDSNEYLLHLSAYVNRNYFIHGYGKLDWKYSSLGEYENKSKSEFDICDPSAVLSQFRSNVEYVDFANNNADYFKSKKEAERYLLE